MLISHQKKFIYTKTRKTAGTSVESFFEKYCMPEGQWQFSHARDAYESDTGIIGYRGSKSGDKKWWHHMPAACIQQNIGSQIWDAYFKFCVIRNPFEKLVSGYYYFHKQNPVNTSSPNDAAVIQRFRDWLKKGSMPADRECYTINGAVCMNYFIRFENLTEDIRNVCAILDITYNPALLPTLKTGVRNRRIPVTAYYDRDAIEIVKKNYAFELEYFKYTLH